MRALVLHEPGKPMTVEDRPVPEPGPGEVLVKVHACGLGLTLVWNRNQRQVGSRDVAKLPRVIGHEVAGTVAATGPGVERWTDGDRVAVYFYLTCGHCRWCDVGREDLCDNFGGFVGKQIDGALAEYVVLPERNLCAIPDEVADVDAAIATDAIATPYHVLRWRARVAPSDTVAVIGGGGGVGIHMVQMARALGARAIAVDVATPKLDLALDAGADAVVDAREGAVDERIRSLTGGRGADVVVELVGTDKTLQTSMDALATGGRLVFVGSYDPAARLVLDPARLVLGELILTGSRYCTRQDLADTLQLVRLGRVRPIVTRTCALEEADEVLSEIERGEIAGRAAAVIAGARAG